MPKKNARKKPARSNKSKKKAPTTNQDNDGRTKTGKFAKGNKGGPGNPYVRQIAALRSMFYRCVTEDDMRDVVLALLAKAKKGDVMAIKELLLRVIGQPTEHKNIEEEKDERHGYFLQVEGGSLFIPDGMSISDAYRAHVSSKRSKKAG